MECAHRQCQTCNLPDEHRQRPQTWMLLPILLKWRTTGSGSYIGLQPQDDGTVHAGFSTFINGSTTSDGNCHLVSDGGHGVSSAAPLISRERMHRRIVLRFAIQYRRLDLDRDCDRYEYGEVHLLRDVCGAEWFGDYSSLRLAYGIRWVLSM